MGGTGKGMSGIAKKSEVARNNKPDENSVEGILGKRGTAPEDIYTIIDTINPRYGSGVEYSKNCALCSVAGALSLMGYSDLEAMPRDTVWRGYHKVFDLDANDYDNYIAPSNYNSISSSFFSAVNKSGIPEDRFDGIMRVETAKKNPNQFSSRTLTAIRQIDSFMKSKGDGAVAILSVPWRTGGAHAMVVYRDGGLTTLIDFQTRKIMSNEESIHDYLRDAQMSRALLQRVDNASIRNDLNAGDLSKMVRRKNNG